jgi:hypothetical protein
VDLAIFPRSAYIYWVFYSDKAIGSVPVTCETLIHGIS